VAVKWLHPSLFFSNAFNAVNRLDGVGQWPWEGGVCVLVVGWVGGWVGWVGWGGGGGGRARKRVGSLIRRVAWDFHGLDKSVLYSLCGTVNLQLDQSRINNKLIKRKSPPFPFLPPRPPLLSPHSPPLHTDTCPCPCISPCPCTSPCTSPNPLLPTSPFEGPQSWTW
jgi:hypothetical protein